MVNLFSIMSPRTQAGSNTGFQTRTINLKSVSAYGVQKGLRIMVLLGQLDVIKLSGRARITTILAFH